jgi:RNA polymerase sigma factor (sigma-70 family)
LEKKDLTDKQQKQIFSKNKLSAKDFDTIYMTYHKPVYDFVYKRVSNAAIAEDLTSTIFEKIVKSINDFQWQGITISAWIFRIARNGIIDFYRKNNKFKRDVSLDEVTNYIESKEPDNLETLEQDEDQIKLYDAIREFKDEDQFLIYYKYFEDMNNKKIAELMGMSETNIGTRLHRIRKKLHSIMEE